ncbi:MAG: right-handed parallel beta-helix repeat-containing protein [Cyclobacteriaceae bacterium]|nr:right-handed parallel beta-helix repeat-containing protein [Cyclobacteriaceae bacterium]
MLFLRILQTSLFWALMGNYCLAGNTFYVDTQSSNDPGNSDGSISKPYHTIGDATRLAIAGDTIIVFPGIYRERIAPMTGGSADKPLVFMASKPGAVYIKGSDIWSPDWATINAPEDIFKGTFQKEFFRQHKPEGDFYKHLPDYFNPFQHVLERSPNQRPNTLGQVFVDGEQYFEVCSKEELAHVPKSWLAIDNGNALLIHFDSNVSDPEKHEVEITTRTRVFAPYKRGLGYIQIKGFVFEHGSTNFPSGFWTETGSPQAGIVSCRGGHHWTIENNTIRFGKSLGLDIGSEGPVDADSLGQAQPENTGYHIIKNNIISDNGCGGIAGIRSTGTKIIGNIFERNNNLGFTAPEIGGVKLHFFIEGLIEANLFRDNYGYGLWLDNVWRNSRVTGNTFVGNHGAGIFIELGEGPLLVDNNIIALTQNTVSQAGDGIYSHDASGVTLAHNLLYFNANYGLWYHVATDRKTYDSSEKEQKNTLAQASDWKILNNIFIGNHVGAVSMPSSSDRSKNNVSDYNLFTGGFPRLTSETHAAKLDEAYFTVNSNKGRQDMENDKGLPDKYTQKPLLTLAEWQTFTAQDHNSLQPTVLRPMLNTNNLLMTFILGDELEKMDCAKIQGIDSDFFGAEISGNVLPGPFQNLVVIRDISRNAKMIEGRGMFNHIKSNPDNSNAIFVWPRKQ